MKVTLDMNLEEAVYWATCRRRPDKTAGARLQNMVILAAEEECIRAGVNFNDYTEVWIVTDEANPLFEEIYYEYGPAAEAVRQLCRQGKQVKMRKAERSVR